MNLKHRVVSLLVFAFAGFLVGSTNLLAPIHEFWHSEIAKDEDASPTITNWNTTTVSKLSPGIIQAGYTGELLTFAVFSIVCAWIGRNTRKAHWITGGFGLGYIIATWIGAFNSYDFNDGISNWLAQRYPTDLAKQKWAFDIIYPMNQHHWAWEGVIIILIVLAFVLPMAIKPKKEGPKPLSR